MCKESKTVAPDPAVVREKLKEFIASRQPIEVSIVFGASPDLPFPTSILYYCFKAMEECGELAFKEDGRRVYLTTDNPS